MGPETYFPAHFGVVAVTVGNKVASSPREQWLDFIHAYIFFAQKRCCNVFFVTK
jgi:hypothetical protein